MCVLGMGKIGHNTAALLTKRGHEVVGVTMKLWREGRYRGGEKDACFGPGEAEDIARAEKLCRKLDIPYHVFDCSEEYEKIVLDYGGYTPRFLFGEEYRRVGTFSFLNETCKNAVFRLYY